MFWYFIQAAFYLFVLWLVCRPGIPTAQIREPLQVDPEFARLFGGYCLKCGATEQLQWDHIVARSFGGTDGMVNLQRLCRRCNQEKNTDFADYRSQEQIEWLRQRFSA